MNGIAGSTAIRNGSSLMYKSYRDDIAQDYGMPYLFVRYVIDRMAGSYEPMAVLPRFYTVDASALTCDAYLEKVTGIPFKNTSFRFLYSCGSRRSFWCIQFSRRSDSCKKGICISSIFRRQWLKIFHSGSVRDPCETEEWKIYRPI